MNPLAYYNFPSNPSGGAQAAAAQSAAAPAATDSQSDATTSRKRKLSDSSDQASADVSAEASSIASEIAHAQLTTQQAMQEYQKSLNASAIQLKKLETAISSQYQTLGKVNFLGIKIGTRSGLQSLEGLETLQKNMGRYGCNMYHLNHTSKELQALVPSIHTSYPRLILDYFLGVEEHQKWDKIVIDLTLIPPLITAASEYLLELQAPHSPLDPDPDFYCGYSYDGSGMERDNSLTNYRHERWNFFFRMLNNLLKKVSSNLDPSQRENIHQLILKVRPVFLNKLLTEIIKRLNSHFDSYIKTCMNTYILFNEYVVISDESEQALLLQALRNAKVDLEVLLSDCVKYYVAPSVAFLIKTGATLSICDYFHIAYDKQGYECEISYQKKGCHDLGQQRDLDTCHQLILAGLEPSPQALQKLVDQVRKESSYGRWPGRQISLGHQLNFAGISLMDSTLQRGDAGWRWDTTKEILQKSKDLYESVKAKFLRDDLPKLIADLHSKLVKELATILKVNSLSELRLIAAYTGPGAEDREFVRLEVYKKCMKEYKIELDNVSTVLDNRVIFTYP